MPTSLSGCMVQPAGQPTAPLIAYTQDECAVDHAQCSHHESRSRMIGLPPCLGTCCEGLSLLVSGILALTSGPRVRALLFSHTHGGIFIRLWLCGSSEVIIEMTTDSGNPAFLVSLFLRAKPGQQGSRAGQIAKSSAKCQVLCFGDS